MATGVAQGGARIGYFYCPESAGGTIDATAPAFKPLRLTGNTLALSANSITSNELRPDRHRTAARRGATQVQGDLQAELTYETFDDLFAAGFCSAWSTQVLKTGTTRTSFAILKRYLDVGVDLLYRGCEVNQIQIACPLQEKATLTFSMIGKSEEVYTVPAGATFATANTNDYMTTFDGSLSIAGAGFNCATAFNLTLSNNLAAKYSLFNTDAYAVKIGMIDLSGDLSAYIEDESLKDDFANDTDNAFSIVLTDKATGGNKYTIAVPRARFTSTQADSFNGDDLGIQQFNWTGLYDTTSSAEISLTKTDAT